MMHLAQHKAGPLNKTLNCFFWNMMAFGFYGFYIKQNFLPQAFGPRTITGQILT
jgi:hypothetical protein